MLTTWLDGLKHVEAVEADPRVCYDSCCFQKMVLRKHWSIAIPRNPNIIPQNQKIKRHQKTSKDKNSAATTANGAPIRESLQVLCLGQCFGSFGHGLTAWLAMAKYVRWKNCGNCGNCGNCHNLRCLWSHGPRHLDDFAESFLMSAFRNGSLRTMKAQIRQRGIEPVEQLICDVTWCYVMLAYVFIELRIQFWWGWRHFLLKWMAGRPSSSRCFCRPTNYCCSSEGFTSVSTTGQCPRKDSGQLRQGEQARGLWLINQC